MLQLVSVHQYHLGSQLQQEHSERGAASGRRSSLTSLAPCTEYDHFAKWEASGFITLRCKNQVSAHLLKSSVPWVQQGCWGMIYLTLWLHCVWSTGWGIWSCSGTPPTWYPHPVQGKKKTPINAVIRLGGEEAELVPSLTLGLTPSTPSGTLGKASNSVETYVMTDFSSGDWTSTSSEGNTAIKKNHSGALIWTPACKKC